MSQHLTICYTTCRRDPKLKWFLDSLKRQVNGDLLRVVIVDLHAGSERPETGSLDCGPLEVMTVKPKPNVWQGEHRLTREDWFAAANARNTGLCLAPDGYIAFVDDLSVLLPGWLERVRAAMQYGYVVCGTYAKVRNLIVEDGEARSFDDYERGHDSRAKFAKSDLHLCEGGWLFGCSCGMPVEALLTIGGWPEYCDGLGSEDYICGLALQNCNFKLYYDQRMKTLESEELHFAEPALKKTDKGKSPDDKSHRALNIVLHGQKYFDNCYSDGIRGERERVMKGEPFTIRQIPEHDWYDGQPIREM